MKNKIKKVAGGIVALGLFFLFSMGSTLLMYRAMAIQGEINAAETTSYYAEAGNE